MIHFMFQRENIFFVLSYETQCKSVRLSPLVLKRRFLISSLQIFYIANDLKLDTKKCEYE